jgi:MFS family permease
MQLPSVLDPVIRIWRHRNFAWFMGGMAPYLVSTWMLRVGTGWLAWELTHSTFWLGMIAAADLAPMLFLSVFAGAFVDRSNPLTVQRLFQWLQVGHAATLAILTFAGLMTIEILFLLCLFLGCSHPFATAARHTLVPATIPKEQIPTGLAIDSAIFNASRFIGPAIAAPLLIWFNVGGVFVAHLAGCFAFLFGLYQIDTTFGDRKRHGGANMLADIREGLAYVQGHPGIAPMFLLLAFSSTLIRPLADMLPGFAGRVFEAGPAGLAWLTASMGIGATISAAAVAIYGRISGMTLLVLVAYITHIFATLIFVATPWIVVSILAGIIWGYTLTSISTGVQSMVQSTVDTRLRGRVMSVYTLIFRGTPAIGAVLIGVLAEDLGLQLATGLAAIVCIIPWFGICRRRVAITTSLEGGVADWQAELVSNTKASAHRFAMRMRRQAYRAFIRLRWAIDRGAAAIARSIRNLTAGKEGERPTTLGQRLATLLQWKQ